MPENTGTSAITLALANNQAGFTSIVYRDANNNGVIDAADTIINVAADLGILAPGASVSLLVKVTAVSGAALNLINTTTLTATTTGLVNTVAAPAVVSATDTTTVISGNVVLDKTQALDAACSGTLLTFGKANISALPNACIVYRITALNSGTANVVGLAISDATPANTTFQSSIASIPASYVVTAPAAGLAGTVSATAGPAAVLIPSATVTVQFTVRVNP